MPRAAETDEEVTMWRRYLLSALIVAIPTVLLAMRVVTDDLDAYGWGWQMFS